MTTHGSRIQLSFLRRPTRNPLLFLFLTLFALGCSPSIPAQEREGWRPAPPDPEFIRYLKGASIVLMKSILTMPEW